MKTASHRESGASAVEMALVAPFLLLLLFGIIEFAWVFGQNLSVTHGAREGARLAAVDFGASSAIATEVCARIDNVDSIVVEITTDTTKIADPVGDTKLLDVGDEVTVTVTATAQSITGFMDSYLPTNLESAVSIRIEQDNPQWTTGTFTQSC